MIAAATMVFAALVVLNHGCASWIGHALVDAPNAGKSNAALQERDHSIPSSIAQHLRVDVGPPAATLDVWTIDPPSASAQGTILVLHGIRDRKATQLGFGEALAARGWRAVLVDLRGHGFSTGDFLTYGRVESRDLQQVLDHLQAAGLLAGNVGVHGSSYGGSIGLQLAGIDARVKAAVAVASFADVRSLVRPYAQHMGFGWLLSEKVIEEGFKHATVLTGQNLNEVDVAAAVRESGAHILLIHGRRDGNIPFQHSQRIAEAAGDRAKLLLLDDADHVSIFLDNDRLIQQEAMKWFDRWLP